MHEGGKLWAVTSSTSSKGTNFSGEFIYHRVVSREGFLRGFDAVVLWRRLPKKLVRLHHGQAGRSWPPCDAAILAKMAQVA